MVLELTEGSISKLSSGEWQATKVKPVLQVVDLRLAHNSGGSGDENEERYRIVLSDGVFHQQGMLATKRNDLVRSKQLQKGSIVRLTEFECNMICDRLIIIIFALDVIHENCDIIGDAKPCPLKPVGATLPIARPAAQMQSSMNQPAVTTGSPQSITGSSAACSFERPNFGEPNPIHIPGQEQSAGLRSYDNASIKNSKPERHNSSHAPSKYPRTDSVAAISQPPGNSYTRRVQPPYRQPPGPMAKNEAHPGIIPIAALKAYHNSWTIKARVTAKGELRRYSNAKGEGKVFSFDLLDSDGGEIRATCFSALADQFYNQVEAGKVYYISEGRLKPAQKAFNHLKNDLEITLDSSSRIQPCFEDDPLIPPQQFYFRPIGEIEGLDNDSVLDIIGVVCSINPSTTIMRKNGGETQKRTLHMKDMSGRSVELTLWGNFCNAEGQTLQNLSDSGAFPVLAVKSARVYEFNGKHVGTISTSQLFVEPDFPEASKLKTWFNNGGKNSPSVSISTATIARMDVSKTISQMKDEKLGTSEKPDRCIEDPKTRTVNHVDSVAEAQLRGMIENEYLKLSKKLDYPTYLQDGMILAPTNEKADEINSYMLDQLPAEKMDLLSADTISSTTISQDELHFLYPIEFLWTLQFPGIPNHQIDLKVGAPIFLLRDFNRPLGLPSDARLIVKDIKRMIILAEIITGSRAGEMIVIFRIVMKVTDSGFPFEFRRTQFPIKVCFAKTNEKKLR